MNTTEKRTVLVVLDGFGERPDQDANAIRLAKTPTFDRLYREYPHTLIRTSGLAVGLPEGQMGNSEVGHMNLGSGRVVYQELTKIDKAISDGAFFDNAALNQALQECLDGSGHLHLMGLASPGGVHSSLNHVYALVELAKRRGIEKVSIHAFLDGRDTPPKSAAGFVRDIEAQLATIGLGRIATVIGRYYAMDRDHRWDRVEEAYRLLTDGTGAEFASATAAIEAAYAAGVTDEFVRASRIGTADPIVDGDAVVFFNFRGDRARELTRALTDPVFTSFARRHTPRLSAYVCMCQYDKTLPLPVAFPPMVLDEVLGQVVSEHGLLQYRTAETEKYAHVTFFFNGGREDAFPGEERHLVPSPKDVATYDQKPEMSATQVADGLVAAIESERFGFLLANFANPDMVGHTGILSAAITAVDVIDGCIARIVEAAAAHDTAVLITADHGNCEQMTDAQGGPHTQHTLNPVPLLVVDPRFKGATLLEGGRLCDVAPTVLTVMGLAQPKAMEGHSLLR
ncbi:MAG: 2,3-bisphosphoglycerate-independent phosphoglycerate mutase [Polyangia bacterium]